MDASDWIWVIFCFIGGIIFVSCGGLNLITGFFDDNSNSGGGETSGGNILSVSSEQKRADAIANAIEPRNSNVRTYALSAIKKSSAGNYNIGQICDIYDELYNDWVYVNDPSGEDYFAPASESIRTLRGDCDDYAILMASLIESIGGSARVICAKNSNGEGHAYTEVYMTDSRNDYEDLIDSLGNRYGRVGVYAHIDEEEGYWLNLDWTASHPGGEFFDGVGSALVVRSNGYYKKYNFR